MMYKLQKKHQTTLYNKIKEQVYPVFFIYKLRLTRTSEFGRMLGVLFRANTKLKWGEINVKNYRS